jgi:hypothetical protein
MLVRGWEKSRGLCLPPGILIAVKDKPRKSLELDTGLLIGEPFQGRKESLADTRQKAAQCHESCSYH